MPKTKKTPNLRFPEFTADWEQRKFKDIAQVRRGLTYKPTDIQSDGVRVLRSSNINEDTFIVRADDVFVNPKCVKIDLVKNNDILITSANGSSRLVGKHALTKNIYTDSVHGGFMLLARAQQPEFVNSMMSAPWYSKFINVFVSGGNGAIGNLSKSDLEQQKILVPSNEEQAKIGSFFQEFDNLIAIHQRKLEALQEQKKGLLQKMFPKDGTDVPELRFPEFSKAWEQRKLGEISNKVGSGKTPTGGNNSYLDEGIPLLRSQNVLNGRLKLDNVAYISEKIHSDMNSSKVKPSDILLNITGASIGRCCIVPECVLTANVNQHVCIIRLDNEYIPVFVMQQIISEKVQKQIDSFQAGGNREGLNFQQVKKLTVAITSLEEQTKISTFFQEFDNLIAIHQHKLETLKEQKKGLLQQMFV